MNRQLAELAPLLRRPGPWCTAYVDAGAGTVERMEAADVAPDHVRDTLAGQGAPKEDVEALIGALQPAAGEPQPVSRFALVRQGKVEVNEVLPGPPVVREHVAAGVIPDLLPLAKHQPDAYPYVVAEVGRQDAEIRLHHAGRVPAVHAEEVTGSGENISKHSGGGWAQYSYQHRTEEVWRQNAAEVAERLDALVREAGARLVVLAGDVKARDLVAGKLAEATRSKLRTVDMHSHTGGADHDALDAEVALLVAREWAAEDEALVERLREQQGQPDPLCVTGLGAVAHALQQAQVETLLFDDAALAGQRLIALDTAPWIALGEGETSGAGILGEAPAPAALLRAAVLTDAGFALLPGGELPGGVEIAALLRWPVGPPIPAGPAA
jgi:Bacterial archaeo-eukaryotic release factor family 2